MATFVLTHGAWHGGWCWRRLADALIGDGHRVFCPTLTGLGERAHLLGPSVTLDTHIADVTGLITAEELSDVVLVGHSYGGAVVTAVADRMADRLAALVFLDAYIATDGRSIIDADPPERQEAILKHVVATPAGDVLMPAPASFYALASEADVAWVDRRQTPHPVATYTQPVALGGAWRTVPRLAYIATTRFGLDDFRAISAGLAGDDAFVRAEIATGHDAMIDAPGELAGLIERLVL